MKIIDSYNAAVELQVGHGGWNDKMEDVSPPSSVSPTH